MMTVVSNWEYLIIFNFKFPDATSEPRDYVLDRPGGY